MGETLDLGCGKAKTPGAVGIDIAPAPGVDIVHDLNRVPWPLADGRFDAVICSHVVEHLADLPAAMKEICRVCKPGARVKIITPHFSNLNSWEDPTHLRHFARGTFRFFDAGDARCFSGVTLRLVKLEITFGGGLWDLISRMLYALSPNWWEKQFAFVFRARNLVVEYEVLGSR
jgi:SAM-dependent methyltransferase